MLKKPKEKVILFRDCKICKITKSYIYKNKIPSGTRVFVDEHGHNWSGRVCSPCSSKIKGDWEHKTGRSKTIDTTLNVRHQKGRKAERMVQSFYDNYGLITQLTQKKGIDLKVFNNDGSSFTVEVKSAWKRKGHESWIVDKLKNWQKKCDLVAMVFVEQKVIIIEPMKLHLSRCQNGGQRTVTKLLGLGRV